MPDVHSMSPRLNVKTQILGIVWKQLDLATCKLKASYSISGFSLSQESLQKSRSAPCCLAMGPSAPAQLQPHQICLYKEQSQPDWRIHLPMEQPNGALGRMQRSELQEQVHKHQEMQSITREGELHLTCWQAFRSLGRFNLSKPRDYIWVLADASNGIIDPAEPRLEKNPHAWVTDATTWGLSVYLHNWSHHTCTKCFQFPRNLMLFRIWTKPWIWSQLH